MYQEEEINVYIIIFGSFAMALMALGIFLFSVAYQKKFIQQQLNAAQKENEYQQNLINAMVDVREEEQKRIAAELHDDIGSVLTHIRMQLAQPPLSSEQTDQLKDLVHNLVARVRQISRDLMPPVLNELGLANALNDLCKKTRSLTKLNIQCETDTEMHTPLSKDVELAIYRICQELLNNIIKHAEAENIFVKLVSIQDQISLIIEDDGKGFVPDAELDFKSESLGMKNLAVRTGLIGANLEFSQRYPKGTRVEMILKSKVSEDNKKFTLSKKK
ncbi:MAG: hypothetical protein IPM74_12240 [Crocinitomicaceae bacterium]|nr:hypothetical protein [Crocinitomicaceae bacterium]MBK8926644.1 hypothetical protein [Crocinitomicaceae bacterium]